MKRSFSFSTMAQLVDAAQKKQGESPFLTLCGDDAADQISLASFLKVAQSHSVVLQAIAGDPYVCTFTNDPLRFLSLACACFLSERTLLLASERTFPAFARSGYAKKRSIVLITERENTGGDSGTLPFTERISYDALRAGEVKTVFAERSVDAAIPNAQTEKNTAPSCGIAVVTAPDAAPRFIPFAGLLSIVERLSGEMGAGRILHAYPLRSVYGVILSLLAPLYRGGTSCALSDSGRFFAALRRLSPQTVILPAAHVQAVYNAAFRFAEKQTGQTTPSDALALFFGGKTEALLCDGYASSSPVIRHFRAAGIPAKGFSFLPESAAALCADAEKLPVSPPKTPEQKQVELAVRAALPSLSEFSIYADFFALGGDAYSAQKLAFYLHIHLQTVYEHPFLFDLARQLHGESLPQPQIKENINMLLNATAAPVAPIGNKTALLTGAEGFLGAHLLKELVGAGFRVYCLTPDTERLNEALRFYFGGWTDDAAIPLKGDLSRPGFGLSGPVFSSLTASVSLVIHAAGKTDLFGASAEYGERNGTTTVNLCDFAKNAGAVFALISDLRVSGKNILTRCRVGGDYTERTLLIGQNLGENACLMSLMQAEAAVIAAVTKGLDAVILRVGTLGWRKSDGVFRMRPEESLPFLRLRALKKLGVYEAGMEKLPVSLLPVDVCAAQCVRLLTKEKRGRVYHLADANPLSVSQWLKKTKQAARQVSAAEAEALLSAWEDDADVRSFRLQLFMAEQADSVTVLHTQTENEQRKLGIQQLPLPVAYYKMFHALSADCAPLTAKQPVLPAAPAADGYPLPVLRRFSSMQASPIASPRLEAYAGAFASLKSLIGETGINRPLFVISDPASAQTRKLITKAAAEGDLYSVAGSGVPSVAAFYALQQLLNRGVYDGIVAVGNETAIGLAKAAAFYHTNECLRPVAGDLFADSAVSPLPVVAVPESVDAVPETVSSTVTLALPEKPRYAGIACAAIRPVLILLDPRLFSGSTEKDWRDAALAVATAALESESCGIRRGFSSDRYHAAKGAAALAAAARSNAFPPKTGEDKLVSLRALLNAGLGVRRTGGGYFTAFASGVSLLFDLPAAESRRIVFAPVLRALRPYLGEAERISATLTPLCGIAEEKEAEAETEENGIFGKKLADFAQTRISRTASPVFLADEDALRIGREIVSGMRFLKKGEATED